MIVLYDITNSNSKLISYYNLEKEIKLKILEFINLKIN